MPYTPEEIKQFEAKDKRINRAAMLKSLIEGLGASSSAYQSYVSDITDRLFRAELMEAADDFVEYIYKDTNGDKPKSANLEPDENVYSKPTDGVPKPTPEQDEILGDIIQKYYAQDPSNAINEDKLKQAVITEFGKYPTNPASVDVVVDRIPIATITN
jgi:hypothetical protein